MGTFGETWVTERRVRRVTFSWRLERAALLYCKGLSRQSIEFRAINDPDVAWTLHVFTPHVSKRSNKLDLPNKVNIGVRYASRYDPFLYMRPLLDPMEQMELESSKESEDYKLLLEKGKTYSISRYSRVLIDTRSIDPHSPYHDIKVSLVYMGRILKPKRIFVPITTLGHPPIGIAADLEKLLSDSDIAADLTIVVESQELRAHRAILSARSPVFHAMFRTDMIENNTGRVIVSDLSLSVVSAMLQYIYTGRVYPLTCSVPDLLAAADRYSIHDLKDACESHLLTGLTVESAYEALCLHEKYNCPKLRTQALTVLKDRILEAIRTPWWEDMTKNEPHILADIINSNRITMA